MREQCNHVGDARRRPLGSLMRVDACTEDGRFGVQFRRFVRRALRVALLTLVLLPSLTACAMEPDGTFESSAWKSQRGVELEKNQRIYMLTSMEALLRVGMHRDEVIELLGPPDYTTQDGGTATDVYYVGVSPYGIDMEQYNIDYRDGRIIAHRSVQG